jgi:hypothetical protein
MTKGYFNFTSKLFLNLIANFPELFLILRREIKIAFDRPI